MIRLYLFGSYELKTLIIDDDRPDVYDLDGLRIAHHDGHWYAEAGRDITFNDGRERVELKSGHYLLGRPDTYYDLHLWVTDRPMELAPFIRRDLFIGGVKAADIRLYEPPDKTVCLFLKDDRIVADYALIYVGRRRYRGQVLRDNDRIDMPGLTFYYHHDFLLIDKSLADIGLLPYEVRADVYHGEISEVAKHYVEAKKRPDLSYTIELTDKAKSEDTPFLVTFGQGLFMSLGMLAIASINAYINYQNGRSITESALVVAMPLMMAVASLTFPLIQKRYRRRKERRDIAAIADANKDKIEALTKDIEEDMLSLRAYHEGFAMTPGELWRRLEEADLFGIGKRDADYLTFAITRSTVKTDIEIRQTGTVTTATKALVEDLIKSYDTIKDVPVPIDLKKEGYVTVLAGDRDRDGTLLYILLSLVLKTNYEDLKIALMVDEDFLERYPEVKNVPHLYDGDVRHLYRKKLSLATKEDIVVLSYYPHYEDLPKGMHYIYLCEDGEIPRPTARIIDMRDTDSTTKSTVFAYETEIFYGLRCYSLAKRQIEPILLKDIYPLDMPLDRVYGMSDGGLKCILGIGEDGRPLRFDLTERGIGPHGLIGGSTGSGKSEFILAMILSLCLCYSAKDLNIAIIDYKGTGLAKGLSYHDEILPHINVALSNLDEIDLDRSLAYFKLECKRREAAFSRLAALTSSSIMDIEDYDRLDPKHYGMPYIPRQLIIIDEFAELKTARPEFIHDIISLARIGRSLGVSLVLATQKPSAVVDQEIWANTAFKVALRVQDVTDSKEVIGTADAAYIRRPGEFYMTSGGDMYHGIGIFTRSFIDERNHETASILEDDLRPTRTMVFVSEDQDRQITRYIGKIIAYHKAIGYVSHDIYKKRLQDIRFIDVLARDKALKKGQVILGIDDDFMKMDQDIVKIDILEDPYIIFTYDTVTRRKAVFDLFLTSLALHARDLHPLIIGEDRYTNFGEWVERISYGQEDDVMFLFEAIKEVSGAHVVIFIEDYMRFIQETRYKEAFERTIFSLDGRSVSFVIANYGKLNISYKLDNIFTKLVFGSTAKEDLIYAFGTYDAVSEEAVYMKDDRLVGFKMAEPPRLEKRIRPHVPLITKIPDNFAMEEGLLGYDIFTRKKVYLPKGSKILFAYYYGEIGDRFRRRLVSDGNYEIKQVKEIDNRTYHDLIVWVGPGIGNQYLFVPKIKGDLAADQAYCVLDGTVHVVRYE